MATAIDLGTANAILARLETLSTDVNRLVERQKRTEEMFEEFAPIAKEVLSTATQRLDELEKKGYFAFGKEALGVVDRVIQGFQPDDVRQLGDAVVSILDTVRTLTQPEVLSVMHEAGEVLQHADEAKPIGIFGLVRATRNDDVQRGMAVMMELLRHVGRASKAAATRRALGGRKRSSPARLALPPGPAARKSARTAAPAVAPKKAARAATSCATPREPSGVVETVIDGVAFGPDGHMVDASAWTRDLGENIARLQGLELGPEHWKVVEFARGEYLETQASPNIRRITQAVEISTKELYGLFPRAPARTVAKIAGIPKPVGCL